MELLQGHALLLRPSSSSAHLSCGIPSSVYTQIQLHSSSLSAISSVAPVSANALMGVWLPGLVCLNVERRRGSVILAAKGGSVDVDDASSSSSSSSAGTSSTPGEIEGIVNGAIVLSTGSPAQSHLDLLERITENSTYTTAGKEVKTIREQLSNQIEPNGQEVTILLSNSEKEISIPELTISQKRNIRRQDYLNKVSERNDAPFFATVAAFVLLPPICILGIAVATGYVELFP